MSTAPPAHHGIVAGLVAGVLAGLFALHVGEGPVREAIRLEQLAEAGGGSVAPLVPRAAQEALLPVATALVGAALGTVHALVLAAVRPHLRTRDVWSASLRLGVVACLVAVLLPAVTTPANPPAVGDADTVAARTLAHLVVVALGAGLALGVWLLARALRRRGTADVPRQLLVGGLAVAGAALVHLLLRTDVRAEGVPAALLWDFRLAATATQLLLWAGIAVGVGLLGQRAQRRRGDGAAPARRGGETLAPPPVGPT